MSRKAGAAWAELAETLRIDLEQTKALQGRVWAILVQSKREQGQGNCRVDFNRDDLAECDLLIRMQIHILTCKIAEFDAYAVQA